MNDVFVGRRKRIGAILAEMGCISADELAEALGVQSAPRETRRLGEILISRGLIKHEHLDLALSRQGGISIEG